MDAFFCKDCGKVLEPGPFTTQPGPCVTEKPGYAICTDGARVCMHCASVRERTAMAKADSYTAYLSQGATLVTTWSGFELGAVIASSPCRVMRPSFTHGRSMLSVRVRAVDGSIWYGRGSPGIVIRLRRTKASRRA